MARSLREAGTCTRSFFSQPFSPSHSWPQPHRWQVPKALRKKRLQALVDRFDHVTVHPEVWQRNVPASSMSCHLFLHAVQEASGLPAIEAAAWALRQAFFLHAKDISSRALQLQPAEELALPIEEIEKHLDRQVLRGNVG